MERDNKYELNGPYRILHVLTAMNRAGTETMLMNLYRNIDKSRVQFDFAVSAKAKCDYDDEISDMGGRIIRYPRYTGINHLSYKKWWKSFFENNAEYKIVHGHIGSTAAIYLNEARKQGRYTIAHSHSAGGGHSLHDMLYKLYSYNTRNVADFFFGCSNEALVNRYGQTIAHDKGISKVIPNGIDVKRYCYSDEENQKIRESFGLGEETLVVGTVGRLIDVKNPFFIIDILTELKKRDPQFCFLWAGDGDLRTKIEDTIRQRGLSENVLLLGVRDDIPDLLQALNVFILPSKYEGLPVIGVEAQAAGIPLLCSNNISRELKITPGCSFLPVSSPELWADRIMDEKKFRRIDGAYEYVVDAGFDVRKTAEWLTDFYEDKMRCILQSV